MVLMVPRKCWWSFLSEASLRNVQMVQTWSKYIRLPFLRKRHEYSQNPKNLPRQINGVPISWTQIPNRELIGLWTWRTNFSTATWNNPPPQWKNCLIFTAPWSSGWRKTNFHCLWSSFNSRRHLRGKSATYMYVRSFRVPKVGQTHVASRSPSFRVECAIFSRGCPTPWKFSAQTYTSSLGRAVSSNTQNARFFLSRGEQYPSANCENI